MDGKAFAFEKVHEFRILPVRALLMFLMAEVMAREVSASLLPEAVQQIETKFNFKNFKMYK